MALQKLSRSQKELHAKWLGSEITRFVGGGLDNSYPQLSSRAIQQRTMEQFISLGYVEEIRREPMNGSVEKITYKVINPSAEESTGLIEEVQHGKLRKAEALEILQSGGYYEEVVGSRYQTYYFMGQSRVRASWHNDWVDKGLVEAYEKDYSNGTLRGCKWRIRTNS